jgi:hypothetical protein
MNPDQARHRTNELLFALLAEAMESRLGRPPSAFEIEDNIARRKVATVPAEPEANAPVSRSPKGVGGWPGWPNWPGEDKKT